MDAAVNSDRENTLIEIESAIKRLRLEMFGDIFNSSTVKNKSGMLAELDKYFDKERKPSLEQQLYDTVVQSDAYKEGFYIVKFIFPLMKKDF